MLIDSSPTVYVITLYRKMINFTYLWKSKYFITTGLIAF